AVPPISPRPRSSIRIWASSDRLPLSSLLREPDPRVARGAPHDFALALAAAAVETEVEHARQNGAVGKLEPGAFGADIAHDAGNDRVAGRDDLRALEALRPRKTPPLVRPIF